MLGGQTVRLSKAEPVRLRKLVEFLLAQYVESDRIILPLPETNGEAIILHRTRPQFEGVSPTREKLPYHLSSCTVEAFRRHCGSWQTNGGRDLTTDLSEALQLLSQAHLRSASHIRVTVGQDLFLTPAILIHQLRLL